MRTKVINLGETGLAADGVLAFRLYREDVDPPEALDASGITAADLGSGDYYFDGLSIDSGQRGTLIIAGANEPLASLAAVSVQGPQTPPVVVYLSRVRVDPQGPFKAHDNLGSLAVIIESGLPSSIADPETRVTFNARATRDIVDGEFSLAAGGVVVNAGAAVVQECHLASDGSWGATLAFQMTQAATAHPGSFEGEFAIAFPGDLFVHIPTTRYIEYRVEPSLGVPD